MREELKALKEKKTREEGTTQEEENDGESNYGAAGGLEEEEEAESDSDHSVNSGGRDANLRGYMTVFICARAGACQQGEIDTSYSIDHSVALLYAQCT